MEKPAVYFVAYQQTNEPPRRAGIGPVEVDLRDLSDSEIQLVGHLVRAAEAMNAVYRDQVTSDTVKLAQVLNALIPVAEGETKEALEAYRTMLHLQNGPWAFVPRKNHTLSVSRKAVAELAARAGVGEAFNRVEKYLYQDIPLPDRVSFYPDDLTEEELEKLGEEGRRVNAVIERSHVGALLSVRNEEKYEAACQEAIDHLKAARALTENLSFQLYLDAKIEEMNSGSEEARRLADYHWVRHDSPIDIVISTAVEVYLDNWKNAKGAASGNVTVLNREADALLKSLVGEVAYLEANAPWTHRRESIDPEKLPKLKFVDVVNWTGDYVTGPMTTIAQSLPNDEWVGKNIGTVNMVYRNTGKAVHGISGSLIAREFLPAEVVDRLGDKLFEAGQLHSALHEIGHTTGRQSDKAPGEPRDYLEAEYSPLEEARAELFGMWSAEVLAEEGVLEKEVAEASHYSMLLSMITALKFEPTQAHNQARNMMWHYFLDKGAITKVEQDGKTHYGLNMETLFQVVSDMLKTVADIKATGDKDGAVKLRETYCYSDELKADVEERTKDSPLGRGLLFPELVEKEGQFTREMEYPAFVDQRKFRV